MPGQGIAVWLVIFDDDGGIKTKKLRTVYTPEEAHAVAVAAEEDTEGAVGFIHIGDDDDDTPGGWFELEGDDSMTALFDED